MKNHGAPGRWATITRKPSRLPAPDRAIRFLKSPLPRSASIRPRSISATARQRSPSAHALLAPPLLKAWDQIDGASHVDLLASSRTRRVPGLARQVVAQKSALRWGQPVACGDLRMPLSLWHRCCANAFLDAIGVVVMCSGSRCPAPSPRAHTSATGQHADLEYSTCAIPFHIPTPRSFPHRRAASLAICPATARRAMPRSAIRRSIASSRLHRRPGKTSAPTQSLAPRHAPIHVGEPRSPSSRPGARPVTAK